VTFVFAPGRDSVPSANETVEYNPARGAGGVFANFMQGMTAKYSDNTRGYRTDFYRNTLSRLYVRVDPSEMNLFLASVSDDHTKEQLIPRLVGNPTPRQPDRTTGGSGSDDTHTRANQTVATNGYLDFFIQQASMPLQEKVDIKETLSDNYVAYFFGQSPPMWTFSGWLLNSVQDDQATNFLRLYLEVLRGTQLARRQKVVSLKIDSYIITGAIVTTNFTLQSTSETAVPFQFQLLVKRVAIVTYTLGWVPTRADTPFAADPNAIPYDGRRMPRGSRAAIASVLTRLSEGQGGPVPERSADPRTAQPPAPTDAVTEQASAQTQPTAQGPNAAEQRQAQQAAQQRAAQSGPSNPSGSVTGTRSVGPVSTPANQGLLYTPANGQNNAATRATQAQTSQVSAQTSGRPETATFSAPSPFASGYVSQQDVRALLSPPVATPRASGLISQQDVRDLLR
jgi:hypothetical protein